MKTHDLKILPMYFERVQSGQKKFEVRQNDRDFQTGDTVELAEWDPDQKVFTGRNVIGEIEYLLPDYVAGISPGFCVFGFRVVDGKASYFNDYKFPANT